jgi:hypothetical protein
VSETSKNSKASAPRRAKNSTLIIGFIVLVAALIGVGAFTSLGGGKASSPAVTSSGSAPAAFTAAAEVAPPAGYTDYGSGISARTAEGACDPSARCAWFDVFAYKNCPHKVTVEGTVADVNGGMIGTTSANLKAMPAGTSQLVQLQSLARSSAKFVITKVSCS